MSNDMYSKFIAKINAGNITNENKMKYFIEDIYDNLYTQFTEIDKLLKNKENSNKLFGDFCGIDGEIIKDINYVLRVLDIQQNKLPQMTQERYVEFLKQLQPQSNMVQLDYSKTNISDMIVQKEDALHLEATAGLSEITTDVVHKKNKEDVLQYRNLNYKINEMFDTIIKSVTNTLIDIGLLLSVYNSYNVTTNYPMELKQSNIQKIYKKIIESKDKLYIILNETTNIHKVCKVGSLIAYILPKYYIDTILHDVKSLITFVKYGSSVYNKPRFVPYITFFNNANILSSWYLSGIKRLHKKYQERTNNLSYNNLVVKDLLTHLTSSLENLMSGASTINKLNTKNNNDIRIEEMLATFNDFLVVLYNLVEEIDNNNFCAIMTDQLLQHQIGSAMSDILPVLKEPKKIDLNKRVELMLQNMITIYYHVQKYELYREVPQIVNFTIVKSIDNYFNCLVYILKVQIISQMTKSFNISTFIFNTNLEYIREYIYKLLQLYKDNDGNEENIIVQFATNGLAEKDFVEIKKEISYVEDKLLLRHYPTVKEELASLLYESLQTNFYLFTTSTCNKAVCLTNILMMLKEIHKFRTLFDKLK